MEGRGKRGKQIHSMPESPEKGKLVKERDDGVADEGQEREEREGMEKGGDDVDDIEDASPVMGGGDKEDEVEIMETPRREITIGSVGSIITATKETEMSEQFLRQERMQGNATDWDFERRDVEYFCRWNVFRIVKFPTRDMMEYSLPTVGMSKEDLLQQRGMISRLVIKQFAAEKLDKEKWWNAVKGRLMMTFVKRRAAVTEGLKRVYEGKCESLAETTEKNRVCMRNVIMY